VGRTSFFFLLLAIDAEYAQSTAGIRFTFMGLPHFAHWPYVPSFILSSAFPID
jgi:hypothetical protein